MRKTLTTTALCLGLGALIVAGTGCSKLKSRDHLNKGVQAFKNAKYGDAVENFKEAIELDPSNTNGRLYLATAYMVQYIPGADSPENLQYAKAAHDEFMKVLDTNPNDKLALAYLASLSYQQAQGYPNLDDKLKKLDEARTWYVKLAKVDPKNKEAYYSLAVIDWAKWYPALGKARSELGMKPEEPGPIKDKKVKEQLKADYLPIIDDGIQNLQKAIAIDPNYDDAMAYMNLLIRERADLDDSKDQYDADIKTANDWVQKALEAKKAKATKQPAGSNGIQADR